MEDLTPLSNLKNLREIEIGANNVRDVSPLKSFTRFDSISLNGNPIENIEVLSHLDNLIFEP